MTTYRTVLASLKRDLVSEASCKLDEHGRPKGVQVAAAISFTEGLAIVEALERLAKLEAPENGGT